MGYTSESSGPKAEELAKRLEQEHGVKVLPVQADMGSENGPAHLVSTALNHFAHPTTRRLTVDVLINNAGVSVNKPIEEIDVQDFANQYNVNVRGPLLLVKAVLPYLPHDRSGRIVNVSSVSASCGFPGQSVYGGTKAALEAMTRTWARELSERAVVNAVNPGPVATDMWASVSEEFQAGVSTWQKNTPLAAVREGIDNEDTIKTAEIAGGRPVCCICLLRAPPTCFFCQDTDCFYSTGIRVRDCWNHRDAVYAGRRLDYGKCHLRKWRHEVQRLG